MRYGYTREISFLGIFHSAHSFIVVTVNTLQFLKKNCSPLTQLAGRRNREAPKSVCRIALRECRSECEPLWGRWRS